MKLKNIRDIIQKSLISGLAKEVFEYKESYRKRTIREHGRTRDIIPCPFCNTEVEVYRWSFSGNGKLCGCGALITRGIDLSSIDEKYRFFDIYAFKLKELAND